MKNFITFLFVAAALCLATSTQAQTPGVYTVGPFNGGTNNVLALATNTTGFTIACSEYEHSSVQFSLKCSASTTGNAIVRVYRSIDSTTYETNPSDVITLVCAGTATVQTNVPLTHYGTGTLKFVGPENTNATAIFTNVTVKIRYTAPRTIRN